MAAEPKVVAYAAPASLGCLGLNATIIETRAEFEMQWIGLVRAEKTRVLTFEPHRQKGHTREVATYLPFEDFRNFHLNRTVRIGQDKKIPLGHCGSSIPSAGSTRASPSSLALGRRSTGG
ncbi:hypothetical protein [Methylobacterium sp. J-070]|uniref:hypothetical protein n=1 Tax=Methylobacterium sp. J-070 TaxID=2836650 RepID=UPI001FBA4D39|nr:hypothetical protein [Methylobacterium sp. J-070]MCJ2049121.1 hypothetical protein [Methylobacterium sp. J-070]